MHKLSLAIANSCIRRNWIPESDRLWCIYVVETKLLSLMFFICLGFLAAIMNILPQTAIFSFVFYSLRKRYGGWHAPCAWLCQLLSLLLVLVVVFEIGPATLMLPAYIVWTVDVTIMVVALVQAPIYPVQAHFDEAAIHANTHKKNQIILIIMAAQLCLGPVYRTFLVYSMLAVFAGVLSVYIEVINQRYRKGRA